MLDTARIYRKNDMSPERLVEKLLSRIRQDPLNAFVTVDEDGALKAGRDFG